MVDTDKVLQQPLNRLLKMAIVAGVETAVRLHIKRGDNLNARDERGFTPLMLAASRNKANICKLLLDAGADPLLFDPSGRNALEIAQSNGALESTDTLKNAHFYSYEDQSKDVVTSTKIDSSNGVLPSSPKVLVTKSEPTTLLTNQSSHYQKSNQINLSEDESCLIDVSGWEPEIDEPAPLGDITLLNDAAVLFRVISEHKLIDSSEYWGDFAAFLPERAFQLPKAEDEESQAKLRAFFLRAVREGSVPESILEELSLDEESLDSAEKKRVLLLTLNELGAETDARYEIEPPFYTTNETPHEEESISSALDFMDDVSSSWNAPLKHYAREVNKISLLNANDEVFLTQEMEKGFAESLDALANWMGGMNRLLIAADLVRLGKKDVEWISSYKANDLAPNAYDEEGDIVTIAITDNINDAEDLDESDSSLLNDTTNDFLTAIDEFKSLYLLDSPSIDKKALRNSLSNLSLSRSFLLELASDRKLIKDGEKEASYFLESVKRQERARDRMILSNLRLVLSIAKRYQNFGLTFDDLIQEGNLGLMKAVDRFDWRRGFKFSTYATWWIKQSVTRGLADRGRTIRVPVHVNETMQSIKKVAEEIERDSGIYPSASAIAKKLLVSPVKIGHLLPRMEEPVSIHELGDNGVPLADLIEDQSTPDPFIYVALNNLRETLDRMLLELEEKQAEVLRIRYGFKDGNSHTLEETGAYFGVTRERVRQIESKALNKLSHELRKEILSPWLKMDFSTVNESYITAKFQKNGVSSLINENYKNEAAIRKGI